MSRDLRSPRYARLREVLVEARKEAGLTQAAVAERLGRPQSYVADIERNERRIDVIEYLALAETIGFDPFDGLREVVAVKAS
ncbi:helix-turn-helix domain-containing protein [Methylopila musalis]|uniref:Helix-turn-helix domain-containing protein n=1 Tax=Methylopila musalis TaxID=1134781 RepID=A0ABW3Z3N3_9HYPH